MYTAVISGSAFRNVCAPSHFPDAVGAIVCHSPSSIRSFTLPSVPFITVQDAPNRQYRSLFSLPLRSATGRMSPLCGVMYGRAYASTVSVSAASTVGAISGDNPHLWFSKDARKAMATELADTFSKILPSKKKSFDKRLKTWQSEESDLEDAMAAFAKKHRNTTYAATEAVAYYLMSDMKLKDVTPQGYLQSVTSGGEAAPADLQEFQELLESDKAKLLVDNPQESSDSTALLKKTATANKVPVIEITEQMPSDQHTLTGWISSLVETMTKQVAAAQTDEKDSSNDTSDGTATDANTQDASPSPSSASQSASDPSSSTSPSSAQ